MIVLVAGGKWHTGVLAASIGADICCCLCNGWQQWFEGVYVLLVSVFMSWALTVLLTTCIRCRPTLGAQGSVLLLSLVQLVSVGQVWWG